MSADLDFQEGDRCVVCRYWWWDDGYWHSLVPIRYADTPELAQDVTCAKCASVPALVPETRQPRG